LRATIVYRAASAPHTVQLTGRWTAVHDWLMQRVAVGAAVSAGDVSAAYEAVLDAGVLRISDVGARTSLFDTFAAAARAVLLDQDERLGGRPTDAFTIDIARTA